MSEGNLLVKNIRRLVTAEPSVHREGPLGVIPNAAMVVINRKIVWLGPQEGLDKKILPEKYELIDAKRGVVMPGLIDCHTHLVHSGFLEKEFADRAKKKPEQRKKAQQSGYLATVEATQAESLDEVYEETAKRADEAHRLGVTTIEVKTGYGLDLVHEEKILEVIAALKKNHPLRVVPTFMVPHVVPPSFKNRRKDFVKMITSEVLPKLAKKGLLKFIEIYVEEEGFTKEEAKEIIDVGRMHHLLPRLHVNQFSDDQGDLFAAKMNAISADHLVHVSDEGVAALKKSETIPVLLPSSTFFTGSLNYPPARKLLDAGLLVALASNYNPGSNPNLDPFFLGTVAITQMQMSVEEVILALTKTPASLLKIDDVTGSLAPGKSADFLLLDVKHEYFPFYRYGQSFVKKVIKKGRV